MSKENRFGYPTYLYQRQSNDEVYHQMIDLHESDTQCITCRPIVHPELGYLSIHRNLPHRREGVGQLLVAAIDETYSPRSASALLAFRAQARQPTLLDSLPVFVP